MSLDAPRQIDYAPPVSARRRLLRRWGIPAILLGLLASTYFWGPPFWERAQTLYWQRRCLTYRASADAVVVDVTVSRGAWDEENASGVVPAEWDRFYSRLSAPGLRSRGTAFLHELRSPDGTRAIVGVDFISAVMFEDGSVALTFHLRPLSVPGGARPAMTGRDQFQHVPVGGSISPDGTARLQLFAGQPDSADPTHFTIRYRLGESEGVIDGWLRQGTVELEPRNATPSTSSTPPLPASPARSPAPAPPATTSADLPAGG